MGQDGRRGMSIKSLFVDGKQPNILLIITDQQRSLGAWAPEDRAALEAAQPATQRLRANGLSFTHMFTATCMCTPSRGALMTGAYPAQTGITNTTRNPADPTESSDVIGNFAALLTGLPTPYRCHWMGKWHLPGSPTDFGFQSWNPPEAGNSLRIDETLGGRPTFPGGQRPSPDTPHGPPSNDLRSIDDAVAFLSEPDADSPWCLVVSLVNPHDVHVGREGWLQVDNTLTAEEDGGYVSGFVGDDLHAIEVSVPSMEGEEPAGKPRVQASYQWEDFNNGQRSKQDFINFYAQLHALTDESVQRLLEALTVDGTLAGALPDDLLVVRMADHGELGLAHNMVEKFGNAYDEAIRIPLVFTNQVVWPEAVTTSALASSIDLLPTFRSLFRPEERSAPSPSFPGGSLLPFIDHPRLPGRHGVHFTYDDESPGDVPSVIRAIRTRDHLYAVYISTDQTQAADWELYDLSSTPYQGANVAGLPKYGRVQAELDEQLQLQMRRAGTDQLFTSQGDSLQGRGPTPIAWPPVYVPGTSRGGPSPQP